MPIKRDKEAIEPGPLERFQIKWEHAYCIGDIIIDKKQLKPSQNREDQKFF